jgi:hypothetical protein
LRPIQQFAFIGFPSGHVRSGGPVADWSSARRRVRLAGVLHHLAPGAEAVRAALRTRHLTGLDDLLEPAQVVADLLVRVAAAQGADTTRIVFSAIRVLVAASLILAVWLIRTRIMGLVLGRTALVPARQPARP